MTFNIQSCTQELSFLPHSGTILLERECARKSVYRKVFTTKHKVFLCGIKYFATANPSKTKRNIVNIKQLSIVRTWYYYSR